jgi:phage shock protein B
MDPSDVLGYLLGAIAILSCLIGLPWLIFHYVTKWKTAATLTSGDEKLLDELHASARRLDDRLCTIERIMTAENPNWRQQCLPGRERDQMRQLLADGE